MRWPYVDKTSAAELMPGVILYGPPAAGKDTIAAALRALDSRYVLFHSAGRDARRTRTSWRGAPAGAFGARGLGAGPRPRTERPLRRRTGWPRSAIRTP